MYRKRYQQTLLPCLQILKVAVASATFRNVGLKTPHQNERNKASPIVQDRNYNHSSVSREKVKCQKEPIERDLMMIVIVRRTSWTKPSRFWWLIFIGGRVHRWVDGWHCL